MSSILKQLGALIEVKLSAIRTSIDELESRLESAETHVTYIATESGEFLTTESGELLTERFCSHISHIMTESGEFLTTESGEFLTEHYCSF
jgi:hypothetical protein